MDKAVLFFVFFLIFSACDPKTPISSSSEEEPFWAKSLLHPQAGPIPSQISQSDDLFSFDSFSSLNPTETLFTIPSSAQSVSSPPVLTEKTEGVTEADIGTNEIATELTSLDGEIPSPLQSDAPQNRKAEEGTLTAQTAQSSAILESIPHLTFNQVFHSEFVTNRMGGSNQYRHYMADTLVYVNNVLLRTNEEAREEFAFLCDESSCSKGLKNVDSLNADDMARMLYKLGIREDIWHIAPLNTIVLQGTVTGKSDFERLTRKLDQIISTHKIDSFWINLSHPWDHLSFMLDLGKFIQTHRVNLRIIGRCSGPCANYLLPATYQVSQVFMEPGGNIFTGGGYAELYREMRDRFQDNTMAVRRRFDEAHFSQGNRKGVRDILHNTSATVAHFILSGPLALNGLNQFLSDRQKTAWEELSENEKDEFISHISPNTLIEIKNAAFIKSNDYQFILQAKKILARLKKMAQKEDNYYKALNKPAGELYAYSDLIRLTTALVKQPVYEKYFIVNRNTPFSENHTSYKAVAPSIKILRQSGINIQGEIHREVMESIYGDPEAFLMLNDEDMQKYF